MLDGLPQPVREATVDPAELDTVGGTTTTDQSDDVFGLLCDYLRAEGWSGKPIAATLDGVIVGAEQRWRAAKAVGLSEVPVRFYDLDGFETTTDTDD